ncbi:MAG TPA: hypothetical protein VJ140_14060, partial [Actinomycetota bacterium]|nr:hypothetical protein [Actinomycetota bacterium]
MTLAIVFGSRTWEDLETIEEVLDRITLEGDGTMRVVTGANGLKRDDARPERSADALADWATMRRGLRPIRVPAAWHVHDPEGVSGVKCTHAPRTDRAGRDYCPAAGNRRNQRIITEHLVPAIETGELIFVAGFRRTDTDSPGTDDMRRRLRPFVKAGQITGIMSVAAGS